MRNQEFFLAQVKEHLLQALQNILHSKFAVCAWTYFLALLPLQECFLRFILCMFFSFLVISDCATQHIAIAQQQNSTGSFFHSGITTTAPIIQKKHRETANNPIVYLLKKLIPYHGVYYKAFKFL